MTTNKDTNIAVSRQITIRYLESEIPMVYKKAVGGIDGVCYTVKYEIEGKTIIEIVPLAIIEKIVIEEMGCD